MSVTVKSRIPQIAANAQRGAGRQAERVAQAVADRAGSRSGSRQVRESMSVERVDSDTYAVTSSRPWRYLEFGTVKMAARPFIVPAAQGGPEQLARLLRELYE